MSLRWKVCGITNASDARLAVQAGADAIGFVLWPWSPRAVALEAAAEIATEVPDNVWRVGVFVDATAEQLERAAELARLDYLQLHGDESPEEWAAAPRPAWKALRLAPGTSIDQAREQAAAYPGAILLVDARVDGQYGGTGEATDWEAAAALARTRRVVLAGGLGPDNVAEAIERVRPWGVDVSSGIELAPGHKDPDKLAAFARALEPYR